MDLLVEGYWHSLSIMWLQIQAETTDLSTCNSCANVVSWWLLLLWSFWWNLGVWCLQYYFRPHSTCLIYTMQFMCQCCFVVVLTLLGLMMGSWRSMSDMMFPALAQTSDYHSLMDSSHEKGSQKAPLYKLFSWNTVLCSNFFYSMRILSTQRNSYKWEEMDFFP